MQIADEACLDLFRGPGRCEWCGKMVKQREPHHILHRGSGRVDIPENLVALCAVFSGGDDCHYRHHYSGIPSTSELFEIAAAREHTTAEACRLKVYEARLKRWRKA